ncbi:MAG: hypothetical protein WBN95_01065, partial [Gammaproteobacteria bacterium]
EPVASADAASANALPGHHETLDEGVVTAGSFVETQVSSVDSQLSAAGYITVADVQTATDDKNRASLLQQPPSVIAAPVEVAVAETVGATEPGQDETIGYLLSLGQESIDDYRLLTPEDDNAYGYFRAVLRLDPANEDARAGIQEIVDLYVIISRKAVNRGDNGRAGRYIDRGLSIQPGNRELLALKNGIDRYTGSAPTRTTAGARRVPVAQGTVNAREQAMQESMMSRITTFFKNRKAEAERGEVEVPVGWDG